MSVEIDKCEELLHNVCKMAGNIIRNNINKRDKRVDLKSCDVDLVTETDQEVERLVIEAISKAFPDHKFIGEESVAGGAKADLTDEPTWIIDPVDGTMNFVHGFPNIAISVGFLVDKKPQLAVVYNPALEQYFSARQGQGAKLNGSPIKVSSETELTKALIAYEFGTSREEEKTRVVLANINNLVPKVQGIRALGSAALNMAMVAAGCADADFEFGIHAWDVAAGWLLVVEAGGVVLDPAGGEFDVMSRRVLCCGTQALADQIIPNLTQYYPERDGA